MYTLKENAPNSCKTKHENRVRTVYDDGGLTSPGAMTGNPILGTIRRGNDAKSAPWDDTESIPMEGRR